MGKKKIIGQDGKEYIAKVKKPFYKRVWFWLLVVVVVIAAAGSIGGGSDDKADKANDSSTKTARKAESKKPASKLTQANFDKIQVSESNGWTQDQVKKLFGKDADSTSTQTIENIKTDDLIWNSVDGGDIASAITIGFSNDHVISKGIAGIKVNRSKKITLADFNKIQNGMSKGQVEKIVGAPNGYDLSSIAGQTSNMWEYTSKVSGDIGANFNVTFTNDVVSGKSQSSMK